MCALYCDVNVVLYFAFCITGVNVKGGHGRGHGHGCGRGHENKNKLLHFVLANCLVTD